MFTTGLNALAPIGTMDERTAQALGFQTISGFTIPTLTPAGATPTDKTMLIIGVIGVVIAAATYFKGR